MKIIGFVLLFVIATIFSALMYGWALSLLWGWFFVTTFGMPALTAAQAIGVATVVTLFTYRSDDNSSNDKELITIIAGALAKAIIVPLFFVGYGWIVHQFI